MKKFSLKLRLMLVFSIFFLLIGILGGTVAWFETKENTDEFFDSYQMALARNLASADWGNINSTIQKLTDKQLKNIKHADEDDEAIGFAVFSTQGTMVFHDNQNGKRFVFSSKTGAFYTEKIKGDEWRIIRVKSADEQYIIAVGQELEYRSDIAWDMVEEFVVPILIGWLILLLLILLIIEREFKPLKNAALQIKERTSEDLSPVVVQNFPKEVMPFVDAINDLLKKLELLLQQERRFVADAAHELRTPLTALNVQLEVLQMCSDNEKERQKALDNLEKGLLRARHLVEQLLSLSRLENSLVGEQQEQILIDWKQIISSVVDDYTLDVANKNIKVEIVTKSEKGPFNVANPLLASLVVRNLFENAVKYSNEGATIKITNKDGILKVFNSGISVDDKHLKFLGQRFYRPSGNNAKGSGLGLSIVKLVTKYYDCELNFKNIDGGFEVNIKKN